MLDFKVDMRCSESRVAAATRTSPRKRIGIASSTSKHHLRADPKMWAALESAYGHVLDKHARDRIKKIVDVYLKQQPLETNAPFTDDVTKRILTLKNKAIAFRKAQYRRETSVGEKGAVDSYISTSFDELTLHGCKYNQSFWPMIGRYIQACARSLRKVETNPAFKEGQAWVKLIRALRDYLHKWKLPFGASKDIPKDGKHSAFVRLFNALQSNFPPVCRRHTFSNVALAKAIRKAQKNGCLDN
jgi:hypothetical protein